MLTYSSLYSTAVTARESGVKCWACSPEISCQSHLAPHARHLLLQHHRFHQTCGIPATSTDSLDASAHLRRMIVITQSKQSLVSTFRMSASCDGRSSCARCQCHHTGYRLSRCIISVASRCLLRLRQAGAKIVSLMLVKEHFVKMRDTRRARKSSQALMPTVT